MSFWKKIFTQEKETAESGTGAKALSVKEDAGEPQNREAKSGLSRASKHDILRMPHLTEKASALGSKRQYIFRVAAGANKPQISRAVGAQYGVRVESVRVSNMPAKERRRGRQIGWKPGFKKAIVRLEEGQTIEIQ